MEKKESREQKRENNEYINIISKKLYLTFKNPLNSYKETIIQKGD